MGFRLRGVRLSFDFCCPPSTGIRRPAKYGTPARRAISPKRRECDPLIFAALRAQRFAIWRSLGRLRGVRFRLPGEISFIDFCCPAGTAFRHLAKFGTPARRAARWGRLWGSAPFSAPLASPPKHPLRGASTTAKRRGHASCAAGASLPRYARSGDLPPRRVNARNHFRSECDSASAKYHNTVRNLNNARCSNHPSPHDCQQFRQLFACPSAFCFKCLSRFSPSRSQFPRNTRFLQFKVAFRVLPMTTIHTINMNLLPFCLFSPFAIKSRSWRRLP